jgi:DNA-binding CsgD family transcriptional regulator
MSEVHLASCNHIKLNSDTVRAHLTDMYQKFV